MANEIYSSSWWGFSSSTGFGNIYDKYNNPDKLANFFEIRVEADGGTVEAKSCLSALGLNQYNWEYNNRVEADGGTIESLECVNIPSLVPTYLLKDDNGFLLQENGFRIIL